MTGGTGALDINAEIDRIGISALQVRVFLLCGTLAILDGYDHLIIGYAAPSLIRHLGVGAHAMGPVFAMVLLGSAIGGLLLAPLADRFGRKPILIASSLIFSLFSLLTAVVTSLPELLVYRLLAGVGLGGATPCFIALACEYAPARLRSVITTLLWAAYPIGGILGGFVSALVIPIWDWEALFYIGGILPILGVVLAALALPESPRFLARIPHRRQELVRILSRLFNKNLPSDVMIELPDDSEQRGKGSGLFAHGRSAATLLLWLGFFFAFILAVLIPLWAPTLLQKHGLSLSMSSLMVGLFNLGALTGMCMLGYLLDRFDASRVLGIIFTISAVAIAPVGFVLDQSILSGALFIVSGIGAGGGAAGMVALATRLYPTEMRSTGIGWGVAMGRFGQMFGPIAGGALVGIGWAAGPIFAAFSVPALIAAVTSAYFGRNTGND